MGKKQGMIGAVGAGGRDGVKSGLLANLRRPPNHSPESVSMGRFPSHVGPSGPTYDERALPLDLTPVVEPVVTEPVIDYDVECASCGNRGHTGFTSEGKCLRCSSYAMRSVVVERVFGAGCQHCAQARELVEHLSAALADAESEAAELRLLLGDR